METPRRSQLFESSNNQIQVGTDVKYTFGNSRVAPKFPDDSTITKGIDVKEDFRATLQRIDNDLRNKNILFGQDIYAVLYGFLNRIRFRYTNGDRLDYCFNCFCCRSPKDEKRDTSSKRHYLFEKAQLKLHNELDVVRIIKTLRKVKSLTHCLLPQRQRMLMAFSRSNLVETSSSSSDSDDNTYDPVRLMESPDPYSRLRINGRIKKLMREFKNRPLE